jgi:hypothetical protein
MPRFHRNPALALPLLIWLLLAAQFSTAVHAFEHDLGNPQGTVCKTCVAAAQLGTACIDTHIAITIKKPRASTAPCRVAGICTSPSIAVRQRGPPTSL